jgi:hypothetical protein
MYGTINPATINPNRLYFSDIEIINDGTFITVNPNFSCPICNSTIPPESKIFNKLPIFDTPIQIKNKAIEFNRAVTLVTTCCTLDIVLNVGIHKEQNNTNFAFLISSDTIPVNWWVNKER